MKEIIRSIILIENGIINRTPSLFWLLRIFRRLEHYYCILKGLQIVECIGDSHLAQIRLLSLEPEMQSKRLWFRPIAVNGATALGIKNPNSKTNAMQIFSYWKKYFPPDSYTLFMLGEVDCGFLIWFLAEKRDQSVDGLFDKTFENYAHFVNSVAGPNSRKIIVSAPLPTIKDGAYLGEIANLRKSISVSQRERTLLTLKLNTDLREWAKNNFVKYVGLDDVVLSTETGVIKEEFQNSDKSDHHYDLSSFMRLLASGLSRNVFPELLDEEDDFV